MKNTKNTPGSICYRVDVYKKNEIGICKGYFKSHFDAVLNVEHDLLIDHLPDLQPCSIITSVWIDTNGDEKNLNCQYFI